MDFDKVCDVGQDFFQYAERIGRSNHIAIMDQSPCKI